MSQKPLPIGTYCLARTKARICVGKRFDGSYYVLDASWRNAYYGLLEHLIEVYNSNAR